MPVTPSHDLICTAIRERCLLDLIYHDALRVFAPHVYGVDSKGQPLLSGYQLRGGSSSGAGMGWKTLRVDEIGTLRKRADKFFVRPEYRHDDPLMERIYEQI